MIFTWAKWVEENIEDPVEINRILAATNWNTWIMESALPPEGTFDFSTPKGTEAEELAFAYMALKGNGRPENWQDYF